MKADKEADKLSILKIDEVNGLIVRAIVFLETHKHLYVKKSNCISVSVDDLFLEFSRMEKSIDKFLERINFFIDLIIEVEKAGGNLPDLGKDR